MKSVNIEDALNHDPFQGDRDSGAIEFSDKIVKAAKRHPECHDCYGAIEKGERHRAKTEHFEGKVVTFRWCGECCIAQARDDETLGEAIEARLKIGGIRRSEKAAA